MNFIRSNVVHLAQPDSYFFIYYFQYVKIILALVFIGLIFLPSSAFGWKSISFHNADECEFGCNPGSVGVGNSNAINFILLSVFFVIGVVVYYKINQTDKFESISLKCYDCGRRTNGLKCSFCEARKQKIR